MADHKNFDFDVVIFNFNSWKEIFFERINRNLIITCCIIICTMNGAQFSNPTCVAAVRGSFTFFSTAELALGLAEEVLVTAIFPVTIICASE